MISVNCKKYLNDLEDVVRLFYPEYVRGCDLGIPDISCVLSEVDGVLTVAASVGARGNTAQFQLTQSNAVLHDRFAKRYAKTVLYDVLSDHTGICLPWGSMTGIRPVRIAEMLIEEGCGDVEEALIRDFRMYPSNAAKVAAILKNQQGYFSTGAKDASLYIHIPVCPSRCYYCSFVSVLASKCKCLDEYSIHLAKDIAYTGKILTQSGFNITSVYVGGGTPTVLTATQLERVLSAVPPLGVEFTVEAGRPDTLSVDKCEVMKKHGVTRVSVNPQTFCDATLLRIGRAHTTAQTIKAYRLARSYDFDINMDLIAGLEGESTAEFLNGIEQTIKLKPDNVTVHTLCKKRGSDVHTKNIDFRAAEADAFAMTEGADLRLTEAGYLPYYLYRQKNMLSGLQNVGYTVKGKQCVNNIDTMEEHTTVAACGSGAISKRLYGGGRIERFALVKPIEGYLERFDEMMQKKEEFLCADADAL